LADPHATFGHKNIQGVADAWAGKAPPLSRRKMVPDGTLEIGYNRTECFDILFHDGGQGAHQQKMT
jgi:hypothetical protein